jgi:LPXTG-motif cell wall-anchored protein
MKRLFAIISAMSIATIMFGGVAIAGEKVCNTETTGWVLESPGPKWVQVDEKTVTDQEAVAAVPGHWDDTDVTFYTWTGGPFVDAPPVYSDDTETSLNEGWNATNGDPQGQPHQNREPRVPYNVSNNPNDEPGLGSWFLQSGVWVPEVPAVDAVTHQEYKFEKTTCVNTPDEPKPPKDHNPPAHHNPPADNPPKADVPPAQPELPHTGANMWLAAVGALMTGLGAGLVKLTARA